MWNVGIVFVVVVVGDLFVLLFIWCVRVVFVSDNVICVLGVFNGVFKSWDEFIKVIGFIVEWMLFGDDVGIFLYEMMVNDGGECYDVVICFFGFYQLLIVQDLLVLIKIDRLKNWKGVMQEFCSLILFDKVDMIWGMLFQVNVDSFVYFYKDLGEFDVLNEVLWKMFYDDLCIKGKVVFDNGIYGFLCCVIYLSYYKIVLINNIVVMIDSEL